jgi:hypothetical protein
LPAGRRTATGTGRPANRDSIFRMSVSIYANSCQPLQFAQSREL